MELGGSATPIIISHLEDIPQRKTHGKDKLNSIRIKRRPPFYSSLSLLMEIYYRDRILSPCAPQLFSQSSNEDLYYPAARARTKPLTVKGQDVNQGVRQLLSNRCLEIFDIPGGGMYAVRNGLWYGTVEYHTNGK